MAINLERPSKGPLDGTGATIIYVGNIKQFDDCKYYSIQCTNSESYCYEKICKARCKKYIKRNKNDIQKIVYKSKNSHDYVNVKGNVPKNIKKKKIKKTHRIDLIKELDKPGSHRYNGPSKYKDTEVSKKFTFTQCVFFKGEGHLCTSEKVRKYYKFHPCYYKCCYFKRIKPSENIVPAPTKLEWYTTCKYYDIKEKKCHYNVKCLDNCSFFKAKNK